MASLQPASEQAGLLSDDGGNVSRPFKRLLSRKNGTLIAVACCLGALALLALIATTLTRHSPPSYMPDGPRTVPYDRALGPGDGFDMPLDQPPLARQATDFQPEQIHVQVNNATSVWVSWATGTEYSGPGDAPEAAAAKLTPDMIGSVVRYGLDALDMTAVGDDRVVYTQVPPASSIMYSSAVHHHVLLTGLEAEASYRYTVGDGNAGNSVGDASAGNTSEVLSFTTAGLQGPYNSSRVRVGVFADVGETRNSSQTLQHMQESNPDIVWLIGDYSYCDNYRPDGQQGYGGTYQPRESAWWRMAQPLLSSVPFLGVPGNHEIQAQAEGQQPQFFASYLARNRGPYNESGSGTGMYYSADVGAAHVILLDPYVNQPHDYTQGPVPDDAQIEWLQQDLQRFDRRVTPWLVVLFHSPVYNTFQAHYKELSCFRLAVEPILMSGGADLVLHGHTHAYERTNRVYNYTLDDCAPTWVTVGDAGNLEQLAIGWVDEDPTLCPAPSACPTYQIQDGMRDGHPSYCPQRQPAWSAFRESSFGHGTLDITRDALKWSWFRNHGGNREAADEVVITQDSFSRCLNHRSRL